VLGIDNVVFIAIAIMMFCAAPLSRFIGKRPSSTSVGAVISTKRDRVLPFNATPP